MSIERRIELRNQSIRIAAGGRKEGNPRPVRLTGLEHVFIQERILGLHREAASAKGDDLLGHGGREEGSLAVS